MPNIHRSALARYPTTNNRPNQLACLLRLPQPGVTVAMVEQLLESHWSVAAIDTDIVLGLGEDSIMRVVRERIRATSSGRSKPCSPDANPNQRPGQRAHSTAGRRASPLLAAWRLVSSVYGHEGVRSSSSSARGSHHGSGEQHTITLLTKELSADMEAAYDYLQVQRMVFKRPRCSAMPSSPGKCEGLAPLCRCKCILREKCPLVRLHARLFSVDATASVAGEHTPAAADGSAPHQQV